MKVIDCACMMAHYEGREGALRDRTGASGRTLPPPRPPSRPGPRAGGGRRGACVLRRRGIGARGLAESSQLGCGLPRLGRFGHAVLEQGDGLLHLLQLLHLVHAELEGAHLAQILFPTHGTGAERWRGRRLHALRGGTQALCTPPLHHRPVDAPVLDINHQAGGELLMRPLKDAEHEALALRVRDPAGRGAPPGPATWPAAAAAAWQTRDGPAGCPRRSSARWTATARPSPRP